ncbi:MAG: hypothetical protein QM757_44965, partial [Paludibaculum sp.]
FSAYLVQSVLLRLIGKHDRIRTAPVDGRRLIYKRKFIWGTNKQILFPVEAYPNMKKIFDFVQEQDAYTIALKAVGDAK